MARPRPPGWLGSCPIFVNIYIHCLQINVPVEAVGEVTSARLPEWLIRDLKGDREEKADRATVVRKLLAKAVREWKIERALRLYREGRATSWRAARAAGLTLREMMGASREGGRKVQVRSKGFGGGYRSSPKGMKFNVRFGRYAANLPNEVGRTRLLRDLFNEVQAPPEVKIEAIDRGKAEGFSDAYVIESALNEGWLVASQLTEENVRKASALADIAGSGRGPNHNPREAKRRGHSFNGSGGRQKRGEAAWIEA